MLRTPAAFNVAKRLASGLSYAHCPGEQPLSPLTVGRLLDEAARRFPAREAIVAVHQEARVTFGQLREKSTRVAAGLLRLGLEPGDRVGIWAPNCTEWEVTQLAAAKAGLVLVNINPAYEAPELRHCLHKVDVRALLAADSFRGRSFQDTLLRAAPDLQASGGGGRVQSRGLPSLQHLVTIGQQVPAGNLRFDDLYEGDLEAAEVKVSAIEASIQPDDGCNIQFTSGTTGNPKATLLSHHGIVNNSFLMGKRLGYLDREVRICLPNPLFHCFGCVAGVLISLHFGATLVMPSAAHSAPHSVRAVRSERCDTLYGTPTMHVDFMGEARAQGLNGADLGLETVVTGGALCPEQLYYELRNQFGVKHVSSVYGMTECSPVNFQTLRGDPLALQASTIGWLGEHWEAKVVDEGGRMVPFGQPGELWVRGYGTMLGYWGEPEATGATLRPDGWLQTGDQFALEESGYGRVVGRIKDMIIRGGENIFPREVEDLLHTHPEVLEAQVYGVPDDRLGEVVCASVRPRPDRPLTPEQLSDFCRGKMAQFKIPRHIEIVQEFPKTTSGKIQKFRLQEMMVAHLAQHDDSRRM